MIAKSPQTILPFPLPAPKSSLNHMARPGFLFGATLALGILISLVMISQTNYLLFHTLVELFSIAVAWGVFMLIWNAREYVEDDALILLSTAFLFVGSLDLMHALTYYGMGVFSGLDSPDIATRFWIAGRCLDAVSLLVFAALSGRQVFIPVWFGGYFTATVLMTASILAWNIFPVCYVDGVGLTTFKKMSEYGICLVLLTASMLMVKKRHDLDAAVFRLITASMLITMAAELCFTWYVDVYGFFNMIGHLLKIAAYFLVYLALIRSGLKRPLDILYRKLAEKEAGLRTVTEENRMILDHLPDGIVLQNPDHTIQWVNAAACESVGLSRNDMLGKRCFEIWWKKNSVCTGCPVDLARQTGRSHDTLLEGPDGQMMHAYGYPVRDAGGKIRYILEIVRNVTDIWRAESLNRFQATVLRQVSDAIITTDLKLCITSWNDAASVIYGYSADETLGKPIDQVLITEFVSISQTEAQEILAWTGSWKGEVRQKKKDGAILIVEVSVSWIRDEDGTIIGGVTVNRDITRRKAVETDLEMSEARYRNIVSALPDLLFRVSSDMRFTDVQANNPNLLLAPPDRIVDKYVADILPQDIASRTTALIEKTFSTGQMQQYHFQLDIRGEKMEFEARMVKCSDREVLLIVRDTTLIRAAEKKLRESEARYSAVVNDQTDLICRFNRNGSLTFVNDAYCRYFGKSESDLIGQIFTPLIHEEDREIVNNHMNSLTPTNPIVTYQHRTIGPAGQIFWQEWTDRAILNSDHEIIEYQSVGRDITDRRNLENQLLETTEREQRRLGQELHDGLCQDLKSLEIGIALLENRLLKRNIPESTELAGVGRQINQTVKKAYSLAKGMLPLGPDFDRLDSALTELAKQTQMKTSARVSARIHAGLETDTHTDACHLFRIAQEALANAVRHSGATGITIEWRYDHPYATLMITDNGSGMSQPRPSPGGMGLTIMKTRAQAIHAGLEIKNRPEGGTEVRCNYRHVENRPWKKSKF